MHDASRPDGFEKSDADPRLISALAVGIAFFLLVVPFLVLAGYPDAPHLGRISGNLPQPQPPAPRLQVAPKLTAERLHVQEEKALTQYSWADRAHGLVRVPIKRAMHLIGERGLNGWPSSTAGDQAPR
jgi:hypothetical protein